MANTCTLNDIHLAMEAGDMKFAEVLLKDYLYAFPDDPQAWTLLARWCIDADHAEWAYPIAMAAAANGGGWRAHAILGATATVMQRPASAMASLKTALKQMPDKEPENHKAIIYRIMANANVQAYKFEAAEHWAKKSLALEDHHQGHTALAFAKLHQRKWEEGWREYTHQLGHVDVRRKHDYGIPEWQGEPDAKVLVYGDQGLGDQIAYMSALPKYPTQVNCHPKLSKLFQRTFRNADVYGDMFKSKFDWSLHSTHQTSMASAMQWATMKRRGRYLEPMREKVLQWNGLLASKGGLPRIGIAWNGGSRGSDGWRTRCLTLKALEPLLQIPAVWVSLEYRDASQELAQFEDNTGICIHDWPWGTQTADYDDTAALVDCLDAVIAVPTTAYHLAGALGVPACVLVHDQPHFHEGTFGPSPWWETVDFIRRPAYKNDDDAIKVAIEWLYRTINTARKEVRA